MKGDLKVLYDEHETILEAVMLLKKLRNRIKTDPDSYDNAVRKLLVFFRQYADEYHHFKEEGILFPEMAKKNELVAGGILNEMI